MPLTAQGHTITHLTPASPDLACTDSAGATHVVYADCINFAHGGSVYTEHARAILHLADFGLGV